MCYGQQTELNLKSTKMEPLEALVVLDPNTASTFCDH